MARKDVKSFLAVAEELQIKGLSDQATTYNTKDREPTEQVHNCVPPLTLSHQPSPSSLSNEDHIKEEASVNPAPIVPPEQ